MKKLFTFLAAFLVTLCVGAQTDLSKGKTWNFEVTSDTDWSNLTADTENWTINSTNDRATNKKAFTDAPVMANGVELEATEGLLVSGAEGKIRIDKNKRLNMNGKDLSITIPGLKKGQVVTVMARTASSSDLTRYLSATNLSETTGFESAHNADEVYENSGTVTADGDVVITTIIGGLNIFSITITGASGSGEPEPEMTAEAYFWDFTTISSSDVDNLTADVTNWNKTEESPENNPYNRYTAQNAYTANPLVANNKELDLTKGLTFTAGAKKIRIDEGKRLNLNGKDIVITTPVLKKGQKVKVIAISSNSSEYEDRFLTASNLENTTGFGAGADEFMEYVNTGVVASNGKVSFTSSGGINIISIEVLGDYTLTIGDAGWATYVAPVGLDFSDADFTAYKVSEVKATSVILYPVTEAATGDAVVVKGTAGTYELSVKEDAAAITGNLLIAAVEPYAVNGNQYVLAKPEGKDVGFYRVDNTGTIPAGKGFLENVPGNVNSLSINDDTNAINEVEQTVADGVYYNLQGQRVARPERGLYIVNGHKVVVK